MGAHAVSFYRWLSSGVVVCLLSFVVVAEEAQVPPRLLQPVDEAQLTVLKGNTHRLARPQFDRGIAPPDLPMQRMLLVLKRSPEQEAALHKLLDDQQDKASPNYHKWLTPEQFGKLFGPADQDIQVVASWLRSHGFEIGSVTKGRTMIEFSGTAAQVQEALHTSIHKYVVNGEEHWANASDPQIPTALTPVVAGVHTLHNFLKKPMIHFTGEKVAAKFVPGKRPEVTFSNGIHALGPADFATIYNIKPLYNANLAIDGTGTTIAIVARSDLYNGGSDLNDFNQALPVIYPDSSGGFFITLNGPDPGDLGGGEEAEVTLDTLWVTAISAAARVLVISATTNTTDGADLSELYIVDNNVGDVMTESFGGCEAAVTATQAQGISMLAEQAAAQGITYVVAAGDNGAEGCDNPNSETVATGPISVNVLAATPYNVAVGGTQFNENGQDSKYWSSTNNQTNGESALSYIPEDVWNQSCTSAQCGKNANIWAGSGGASTFFTKPSWQANVPGIPNNGWRDLPDVSLTAAGGHDPYLICLEGSCVPNSQGYIYFYLVGGTSASTPAFAGIMSLVDQKMGQVTKQNVDRQGQADYVLYPLAAKESPEFSQCNASNTSSLPASTCIFNDVTVGNNEVPGERGYPNAPYNAGAGYDQATGLGSVNVANLVNGWASITFNATTTALSASPTTTTHGQPVNVDVTVTPNGDKGSPSGEVSLLDNRSPPVEVPLQNFILSGGALQTSTNDLPGGSYGVTAHYAGDGTFAPSNSSPVSVTVSPEASQTKLSVCTYPTQQNSCPAFTGGPYGSFVYLRADVSSSTQKCPPDCGAATGNVTFTDNDYPLNGCCYLLNSQGNTSTPNGVFIFPPGPHAVWAAYSGDSSYNPSQSSIYSFTMTPAATSNGVTYAGAPQGATLTATITTDSGGTPPSGLMTFSVNGKPVGNGQTVTQVNAVIDPITDQIISGAQATASYTDTQIASGQTYNVTAAYSGDSNYKASNSPVTKVSVQPDFVFSENQNYITVSGPGGSGSLTLTITANDGYNGTVNFSSSSCSGLPAGASCSFSPASVAGSGSTTLTVTTTASTTGTLERDIRRGDPMRWAITGGGFVTFGIILLGVPRKRRCLDMLLPFLFYACLVAAISCGGGSSQSSTPPPPPPSTPTPAGSYPVAVTATSGSLTHKVAFTLAVQ